MKPCQWCDGSGVDPVGMPGEPCPACQVKRLRACRGLLRSFKRLAYHRDSFWRVLFPDTPNGGPGGTRASW
jgi:hypothetical protein